MSQQPGYTIVGTTDAISPILIPSNTTIVVRSLTLTPGTWLLNAVANIQSTTYVFLSTYIVGFSGGLAKVVETGFVSNMMCGCHFGKCISHVIQTDGPITIDLEVTTIYTTSDGEIYVNNVDDEYIHFTATLLSS